MMESNDEFGSTLIKSPEEALQIRRQVEALAGCLEGTDEECQLAELQFRLWVWDELNIRVVPPHPWCRTVPAHAARLAVADAAPRYRYVLMALASAWIYFGWDSLAG